MASLQRALSSLGSFGRTSSQGSLTLSTGSNPEKVEYVTLLDIAGPGLLSVTGTKAQ